MSTFFRALEQAERERAQKDRARHPDAITPTIAEPVPPDASAALTETPPSTVPRAERPAPTRAVVEPARSQDADALLWKDIDEHLVSLLEPASFEAEQYRTLRHTVEQLHRSAGLSVFAVSSPAGGDGKTLTSIDLAGALAQAPESRVLLVDVDLRHASVSERLGLDNDSSVGLVDAILDPALTLDQVAQRRSPYNLSVVLAGRLSGSPYELLKSPRLGELFDQARAQYDYVVVDTPPMVSVPDCRVIGKWVDGFFVVVAAQRTPRRLVEEALNVIEAPKLVGFIFNGDARPLSSYGTGYGYSMDADRGPWWDRAARSVSGSLRRGTAA
jgi:capsular exopolysaccharide synthesis family protein